MGQSILKRDEERYLLNVKISGKEVVVEQTSEKQRGKQHVKPEYFHLPPGLRGT